MAVPKAFIFVDGENLVMRYQAMVASGAKPKKDVIHIPDVFVWHPDLTTWSLMDIQRVMYYTSATGDQKLINELRSRIASVEFSFSYETDTSVPEGTQQLVPRIFHKDSKSRKTRNVDINIVIDVMRASHLSNAELLVLLSGDGDYIPLVEEAMRLGKPVWTCAFSSGLNEILRSSVDAFEYLDGIFFQEQLPGNPPSGGERISRRGGWLISKLTDVYRWRTATVSLLVPSHRSLPNS